MKSFVRVESFWFNATSNHNHNYVAHDNDDDDGNDYVGNGDDNSNDYDDNNRVIITIPKRWVV